MDKLKEKIKNEIKRIFKEEKESGRFSILSPDSNSDVDLLLQILMSEFLIQKVKKENFRESDQEIEKRKADFVFIAAPTGAGKDTLVRKVIHDNPDKKYVVLNMDMFRSYYGYFFEYLLENWPNGLTDKTFATQTNGFSYEIYYTMQRLLLENFPGTNIIITGTIRETDWVEETFRVFKSTPYTEYTNKLFALAVPKKICEISVIQRYLASISLDKPGTARYVSVDYYNDTIENYINNFAYFESILNSARGIIDTVEVYKRSNGINDYNEDTLLYTSDVTRRKSHDIQMTASQIVAEIVNHDVDIGPLKIADLVDTVELMRNYLIEQGLYREILCALQALNRRECTSKQTREPNTTVDKNKSEDGNGNGQKYPGSDD